MHTWREERERCKRQIDMLHSAEDTLIEDGIALLDLARQLHQTFTVQPAETEKGSNKSATFELHSGARKARSRVPSTF
jgi:hypothetical protein